jgi:hypothetical protein
VFRGESYIDTHMEKRHADEVVPGGKCLADLCGPLHCDYFEQARKGRTEHLRTIPCHGRTMEAHKVHCQVCGITFSALHQHANRSHVSHAA